MKDGRFGIVQVAESKHGATVDGLESLSTHARGLPCRSTGLMRRLTIAKITRHGDFATVKPGAARGEVLA